MEPYFSEFPPHLSGFNYLEEAILPFYSQRRNLSGELNFTENPSSSVDTGPRNSSASSNLTIEGDGDCHSDDIDFSDSVFKYIKEMLMEEDMEAKPCMFHDPLALQATEKSFQDVLCEGHPSSTSHQSPSVDTSEDSCSVVSGDFCGNSTSSISSCNNFADSQWAADSGGTKLSILQSPVPKDFIFRSTTSSNVSSLLGPQNGFFSSKGMAGYSLSGIGTSNYFTDEAMQYFRMGAEEASKFLPKGNQLLIDLGRSTPDFSERQKASATAVKVEKDFNGYSSSYGARLKKHGREHTGLEDERSSKQLATCIDEVELSDMFDRVLLCRDPNGLLNESNVILEKNAESRECNAKNASSNVAITTKEVVDLRDLLLLCAHAVSAFDHRIASQHLQIIRKHSSPLGNGSQRLAYYFANALEARMNGTGAETYATSGSKKTSVVETLKAYQVYISVCPFQRFGIIFGNHMSLSVTENAKTIHVIDFGILYGFQWPAFIHCLSRRAEPPLLRMTGIELPQRGFRPSERVEETGRRLAKYCKRFNVPFEYIPIAQRWETIRYEDLKIIPGEVVIVNCLFRFKNLFDETVSMDSPRVHVLNLVSKIKPRLFIHSVVNGNYNGSVFLTRFREALYHYSAMFDAFDAKLAREDPMRRVYEREFFAREALNVIACEDTMRIERPETYRQWQARHIRAGMKPLPLDPVVVKKLKTKLTEGYHDDFVLNDDGNWLLQGWKGRILHASSCWVPASP